MTSDLAWAKFNASVADATSDLLLQLAIVCIVTMVLSPLGVWLLVEWWDEREKWKGLVIKRDALYAKIGAK